MIILQTLKWLCIAVAGAGTLLAALAAAFLLAALADHLLYTLSRHRTLKALTRVHALKVKFETAISQPDRINPLMRGFSIPLTRFDCAVETLARRVQSLQDDNDVRHGPHARSEWRHLRKDIKRVLRRGKQLDYFSQAPDARDGIWPFAADHAAIYADNNYEGREPALVSAFAFSADAMLQAPPVVRVPARHPGTGRNFGIGRGALDEDVMPSADERRQAFEAALAGETSVSVLNPGSQRPVVQDVYDRTGKVLPFKRPGTISVKA